MRFCRESTTFISPAIPVYQLKIASKQDKKKFLDAQGQKVGTYLLNLPKLRRGTLAYSGGPWQHRSTIFYRVGWIAWRL